MQTIYRRFSVLLGFTLLLIVLLGNTVVIHRQIGAQVENQSWVRHTQQVRFELSQTESLLKDAETGQRGFLYTGDPTYLAPFNQAIAQIDPHLDHLAQLTADNSDQQANLSSLRTLAHQKIDELVKSISLYQAHDTNAAKAMVISGQGKRIMDDLRSVVDRMQAQEVALEDQRLVDYQLSVRTTKVCVYLATFIACMGLFLLAYTILREMDLRERHERMTAQREEWFRSTLTSLGDGVIATDRHGLVTFVNLVAEQLIGIEQQHAIGKPITQVFPIFNEYTLKPVDNPVHKVLELGHVIGLANHTVLQHMDGSTTPIEDSAAPIRDDRDRIVGVVLVFRDASQERRAQEVMRKSEKLAAAARLSATVAHEINNPLESVGNLLYLAKNTPDLPTTAFDHLTLAEQELERVAHITRQTLGFYRESRVGDQVPVAALIESVLNLYSNKLKSKNITVIREFADCPPVNGRTGELKQVVANIISNAIDAVSNNGTVRVQVLCVQQNGVESAQIFIQDDGPGVPPELRDKIFEPFFTTKANVGTGLGLWVVKEIVDRHGGSIRLHPSDDASPGTTFGVLLPLAQDGGSPSESTAR
jgi:PAS domain S-box-containing protein